MKSFIKLAFAALLAAACGTASADPTSAVYIAFSQFMTTYGGYVYAAMVAISVYGSAQARRKARAAAARERAEYNANLIDRSQTFLSAAPAQRIIYGRVQSGGDLVAIFTSDKAAVKQDGTPYVKADAIKHLVIHVASHEIEAFHDVYISGIRVGTLDANGQPVCTSVGTGSGYVVGTALTKGATSIPVASGTGTILVDDEVSFPGESTRYKVVTGITAPGTLVIAAPGLVSSVPAGAAVILGTEFNVVRHDNLSVTIAPGGTYTNEFPIDTFDNFATLVPGGESGYEWIDHMADVTLSLDRLTLTNAAATEVKGNITFRSENPTITLKFHLGSSTQTVDTYLNALKPTEWTTDHRLRGRAYVVMSVDLEEPKFQSWDPTQLTFDVSGKKVYDPRTLTTAYSTNPALCIRDVLLAPWGMNCVVSDIDEDACIASANICDELIDLTIGAEVTTDQPRYTCNGLFTTEASLDQLLTDLSNTMAGTTVHSVQWTILAGAWSTPVLFPDGTDYLGDEDLMGNIEVIQAGEGLDTLFNGVRGQYFGSGRTTTSDMQPYQNSTFVTADGEELWFDLALPFTDNKARCRNIARILTEKNRDGQVISFPATLKAWPLRIGDRIKVTNTEMGLTLKTYRVTDWQFGLTSPVVLTLQEDGAGAYDLADATSADPEPNSGLVDPWFVNKIKNLVATSGSSTILVLADGTAFPRVLVTWDQVEDPYVSAAQGGIVIGWIRPSDTEWTWITLTGDATSTYIVGPNHGDPLLIQAFAVNSIGRFSVSVYTPHTVNGVSGPASDPTGLDWEMKPAQVWITWDPCPDYNYLATELRVGGTDWDSATFMWKGISSDWQHPRPANGTYPVWIKHINKNRDYSINAATVNVVVDDSIDGGGGGLLMLEIDGPPIFRFADGTTHTTVDPDLTLTAHLIGLYGEAEWEATAYDAMTGGVDLGPVTLTGTGNARVVTGANFVAPGTAGSVRRVEVVASIGAAFDMQPIYRYDPTVTEPFLYLSNPVTPVPTDEAGLYGDYSRTKTMVVVLDTGSDVTTAWTLSIEPDPGITATINGVAGPVTGVAIVEVAVSDSTLTDGVVLIRAVKAGETDLTAPFRIVKRPAQGAERLLYFAPRTDIVLPVDSNGVVTSFSQAWTLAKVRLKNGVDATDQWTYTKEDEGVTSTITDNRIQITGFRSLGELATVETDFFDWTSSGWERPANVIFAGVNWVTVGINNFALWQKVQISPLDKFDIWTEVDTGVSGRFNLAAYDQDALCLLESATGSTNLTLISTDGGASWAAGATLPHLTQWYAAGGGDGYMLACPYGGLLDLARSSNGGASWSTVPTPGPSCTPVLVGPTMIVRTSADTMFRSINAGASWSAVTGMPTPFKTVKRYKGYLIACFMHYVTTANVMYSSNEGATWQTAVLANTEAGPDLIEIAGVLYLVGSKLHYTVDGKTWKAGATLGTGVQVPMTPPTGGVGTEYLPRWLSSSGAWYRNDMLALDPIEGAVHVTAHQPGQDDLKATLPVQLGSIVPPVRISNINPAFLQLPATSDGVVTNFDNAVIEVNVVESSLTVTSDYTWTWTATHLTPSSGTGSTATFTAMDVAEDRGRVSFVGTAAGHEQVTLGADVVKLKGPDVSGIGIGAAYNPSAVSNTYLGWRLTSTGVLEQKEGSAGSWLPIGQWFNPTGSGAGSSAWVRFDLFEALDGVSTLTATLGTFLALTSDRSIVFESTTSGLHKAKVVVYLSPNSGGTLAQASLVTMLLTVP